MTTQLYDEIGKSYTDYRRPDPRIAAAIVNALGTARSVVNIGAGAGSYEPRDRDVVAVEPSQTMIRQRLPDAAAVVRASAMALPFSDDMFDAALAILTVHHWLNPQQGLREMMRVARRAVILSWEPSTSTSWLTRDYFPQIRAHDEKAFPLIMDFYGRALGAIDVRIVPVPHDCSDGFLEAYWRRPEAYFDPGVRRAISSFARVSNTEAPLARLRRDLDDGTWQRRNGRLLKLNELDLGYRLIVANRPS